MIHFPSWLVKSLRAKARLEATYISGQIQQTPPSARKKIKADGKPRGLLDCQSDLFCYYPLSLIPCSQQPRGKYYNAQAKASY